MDRSPRACRHVTYDDFRRANRMGGYPAPPATGGRDLAPYEPSFAERRRAAAGPWAFVLDTEADDRVLRRALGIRG